MFSQCRPALTGNLVSGWPQHIMPPRKRARIAPPSTATSMGDVSKVQLALRDWLQEVHGQRHIVGDGVAQDGSPPAVPGWPNVKPGTFREIAKSIWSNPQKLLKRSLDVLLKAGILEVGSTMEDLNNHCLKLHVPRSFVELCNDCSVKMSIYPRYTC